MKDEKVLGSLPVSSSCCRYVCRMRKSSEMRMQVPAVTAKTAKVIDIDLTDEEYAFGVDKNQPELLEQVNAFISKIKEDGTLDEICDKYFGERRADSSRVRRA